jgi:hypothetical protein
MELEENSVLSKWKMAILLTIIYNMEGNLIMDLLSKDFFIGNPKLFHFKAKKYHKMVQFKKEFLIVMEI